MAKSKKGPATTQKVAHTNAPAAATAHATKLTQKEVEQEIKELLRDLADATDASEKKRIRRTLRSRGHWGGLRTEDQLVVSKAQAAKAVAVAKSDASDDDEDAEEVA